MLTRLEAAQWIADVGKGPEGERDRVPPLAGSTVELDVADPVAFEAEIQVDGDEVELGLELTGSMARTGAEPARSKGPAET